MSDHFQELPTRYDPATTETAVYERWLADRCFRAVPDDNPKRYCITIPPPNITGALHLGHALNNTIMDTLGRWKRMSGHNTLILPGTDHGGISTQSVVERDIAKEKLTRYDLGREAFTERVNQWADQYGNTILNQLKRLGCSYDWERTRYTLDEPYVDAIMVVFERLYEQGYIYLGYRIVNWCPFHRTAISDIEVEREDEQSFLYHIRYPFADGSGEVTVATTRPETMLGDTAVAVNPKDPRYEGRIGKALVLPLVHREIPLIADDFAEMDFGTGAVKVTPAHDPNDFEAGVRNHLPTVIVIGPDGRMNENAGAYAGSDRFEARKRILEDLEAQGYLVKTEPHTKSVGRCDRCKTVIEPLLSRQWFCRMTGTPMVSKAIAAARNDEVRFLPGRYREIYLTWMENLRDWPISRQLWWGHRMPLWRKSGGDPDDQASYVAARTREQAEEKAGTADIEQVEDVLDTWFSSALWPFATLGWPDSDADLKYYYPTNGLFTAQEILYLWVARMIMAGEEFLGEKPFDDVYIHATILDEHGRRMSKSKGNGIDPLDLIELYGADALRYFLMSQAGLRQDIRMKPIKDGRQEQVEQARNFCNKIWNASRFALLNLEGAAPMGDNRQPTPTTLVDRWILSRLSATAETVGDAFGTYNLDDAARALYQFFWDDFCDWYIEAAKPRFQGEGAAEAKAVLGYVLERTLRLLHPIMPFITEAIWQALPGAKANAGTGYLMFAAFPTGEVARRDEEAEAEWEIVQEITRTIRNVQAENQLKKGGEAYFIPSEPGFGEIARVNAPLIEFLTRCSPLAIGDVPGETVGMPNRYGEVRLPRPRASAEEIAQERARIEKELAKLEKELSGVVGRLSNESFVASAPPAVVEKARSQAADLQERGTKLRDRLASLE
ncbi:MAG: valine--tRNA ligase [Capsulimonadales bacterium]|nr:valine--tRNA ligase [Capsulimonadales bacterium]